MSDEPRGVNGMTALQMSMQSERSHNQDGAVDGAQCDWYREGRGRCLLKACHGGDFHTCEEDGRLIEQHRNVRAGALKNCDPKLTVDVALKQMDRCATYDKPTENEQTIIVLATEILRMRSSDHDAAVVWTAERGIHRRET